MRARAVVLVLTTIACRSEDRRDPAPSADPVASVAQPVVSAAAAPLEHPATEIPVATVAASASAELVPPNPAIVPRAKDSTRAAVAAAVATAPSVSAAPSLSSATAPPKAPPIAPRRGAVASGPSYEVWLETTGGYSVGATGSVIANVTAKPPYKCNTQYPYKLALDAPPAGVTYASAVVRGMRVDGKHASMPVQFSAASAGSYTIAGTLSFSTCTEDKCLVDKAHVGVTVEVR